MKNSAALITGSAKRLGREMALFLAAQGYDIAISYNSSLQEAQNLAQEISQKFQVETAIFQANLNSDKAASTLITDVIKKFPQLNLLINNASIFNKSKFLNSGNSSLNINSNNSSESLDSRGSSSTIDSNKFALSNSALSDNLNIHLIAPLILSQEFAQNIIARKIKNAQIINMVDKNIARFDTGYFHYLLSKKFLAEATKMLALELAPHIRVNAIAPGFILNSIDEKNPSAETEKLLAKIPLQNKGDASNICQALEFLMQNNFVTGQVIFVDGGASLNHAG